MKSEVANMLPNSTSAGFLASWLMFDLQIALSLIRASGCFNFVQEWFDTNKDL
jgi:hypothetical protein